MTSSLSFSARRPHQAQWMRALATAALTAVAFCSVPAWAADNGTDSTSATAGNQGKPNTLDPEDKSTVPQLLQAQQSEYQKLESRWNTPDVPHGLPGPKRQAKARDSGMTAVGIEVHNVDFELDDGVGYYIKSLKGTLVPHDSSEPVNFDDPDQYDIHIHSGTVVVRPSDLDALFNNYVLTYEPRALSSVENHTRKDTLTVDVAARLFRFIPPVGGIPNVLTGSMKIADGNTLVYTPSSVKSLGLPLKPLLEATGMSLAMITPFDRTGVKLSGNQLIMDPARLFPLPKLIIDDIKSATLSDAGLTLVFDSKEGTPDFSPTPVKADSYIWLQSGDPRFFGTVLVNARLLVLNNSHERLHFNLYHYRAQTAAGKINIQNDGTLIVRVPNTFKQDDDSPKITENAKQLN